MAIKWTEKDVMEHAKELKSPFEQDQKSNGRGPRAVLARLIGRGQATPEQPEPKE